MYKKLLVITLVAASSVHIRAGTETTKNFAGWLAGQAAHFAAGAATGIAVHKLNTKFITPHYQTLTDKMPTAFGLQKKAILLGSEKVPQYFSYAVAAGECPQILNYVLNGKFGAEGRYAFWLGMASRKIVEKALKL